MLAYDKESLLLVDYSVKHSVLLMLLSSVFNIYH